MLYISSNLQQSHNLGMKENDGVKISPDLYNDVFNNMIQNYTNFLKKTTKVLLLQNRD